MWLTNLWLPNSTKERKEGETISLKLHVPNWYMLPPCGENGNYNNNILIIIINN